MGKGILKLLLHVSWTTIFNFISNLFFGRASSPPTNFIPEAASEFQGVLVVNYGMNA